MTIGDDGIASICMSQEHVGDPCERCGHGTVTLRIVLDLEPDLVALLNGTLMRAADQYPNSPSQRRLFELVEAASDKVW